MVFGYVAFQYYELLVSQGRIQGGGGGPRGEEWDAF